MTLAASAGQAQSLAEVARREEERRKAIASPGRVFTNDNLQAVAPATAAPPSAAPAAASPPAASSTGTGAAAGSASSTPTGQGSANTAAAGKEDGAKKGEAYWRQRIQQSRDALQRAEIVAAALQSRINALTADAVNRDDPAQRSVITADREKALHELERVKKDMQQHAQAVTDTQEEARRAGVPAGWVR